MQKFGRELIRLRASSRKTVRDIIILNGNLAEFRLAVLHCSNGAWVRDLPGNWLLCSFWFLRIS